MARREGFWADGIVAFGAFRLNGPQRLLQKNDEAVPIGSRALDILIALVERAGEVVPRRELLERAWPDLVVEEANVRVHIAGLRKLLGDGESGRRYVANIPGRGYSFVAPIQRVALDQPADAPTTIAAARAPPRTLPPPLARMVGRDETRPAGDGPARSPGRGSAAGRCLPARAC